MVFVATLMALSAMAFAGHQNFVTTSGTHFLDGASEFYYAGTNNYYLWYKPITCSPANEGCVEEVLDDAVAMNLTVIRTWGFGDGDNGGPGWDGFNFQPSPRVYDNATFEHFDEVLGEAHSR